MNALDYFGGQRTKAKGLVAASCPDFSDQFTVAVETMNRKSKETGTEYNGRAITVEEMFCLAYEQGLSGQGSKDRHVVVHPQWPMMGQNKFGFETSLLSRGVHNVVQRRDIVSQCYEQYRNMISALLSLKEELVVIEYDNCRQDWPELAYDPDRAMQAGDGDRDAIDARFSPQEMAQYFEMLGGFDPYSSTFVSGAEAGSCPDTVARQLFWSHCGLLTSREQDTETYCNVLATAMQIEALRTIAPVRMHVLFDLSLKGPSLYRILNNKSTIHVPCIGRTA